MKTRRQFLATVGAGTAMWIPDDTLWAAPSKEKPLLRFGLLADVQYADIETHNQRFYRHSIDKLKAGVARLNACDDLAFIVHLGDAIDKNFASFDAVMPEFEKLSALCYQVLGNHDFDVAEEDKAKVPKRMGLEKHYHAFEHAERFRFLVLDGTEVSTYVGGDTKLAEETLERLKNEKKPYAQRWNGGMGDAQLAWLEGQLKAAAKEEEEVIIFCHYPVFPEDPHNLWSSDEVLALLEDHEHVRAWFNGHNHAGNYGEQFGTHFLTLRGIVETADTNAHAIVSVFSDHLEVDGFDREPDRILRFNS